MKKFLYTMFAGALFGFATPLLGSTMMTFGSTVYFDLYFIPFLLFYIFYFIEKYFFRIFLSISKTRSALGAGIINGVCSLIVFLFLHYFVRFSWHESISFMCIPDVYYALALQFQDMQPYAFYAAFAGMSFLKLFIFMNVFEERKSWIAPLIVLILARLAQLASVFFLMKNVHDIVAYAQNYISIEAFMAAVLVGIVVVDYVFSLFFKTREEDF